MLTAIFLLFPSVVAPRFVQRPEDQEAVEGDQVQLMCVTHGYPTPTLSWRRDGEEGQQAASWPMIRVMLHDH